MSHAPALTMNTTTTVTTSSPSDLLSADRTSRSRFKNLFSRRRLSPSPSITTEGLPPDSKAAIILGLPSTDHHDAVLQSKLSPSPKLPAGIAGWVSPQLETNARLHTHLPSPVAASTDSRLFYHAYSRAPLRSSVQIPLKSLLSRLPLSPSGARPSTATADVTPAGSRRGSISGMETKPIEGLFNPGNPSGTFVDKIFVLEHGGAILQFKVDGAPDRLPEKVFQLTADSVVLPTDAVAGMSFVLEVTIGGNATTESRPKTNRSTWSMNPFRASVSKRSSESVLMIFDNPDIMSTWLLALRKGIENATVLADRPQSSNGALDKPLPALRTASTERFSLRQSFLHLSRSSSSLRAEYTDTANIAKDLPNLPLPPPYRRTTSSRSVAASSVATATSLDRFKESDNTSTTTAATNSLDGSISLDSPLKESFASMASPTLEPLTSPSVDSHTSKGLSTSVKPLRERRKSSVVQLRLTTSNTPETVHLPQPVEDEKIEANATVDVALGTSSEEQSTPVTRPLSFLPPLPSADEIKRTAHLPRTKSVECVDSVRPPKTHRPASSHAGHQPKPSVDASGKSLYSLFPKKRVDQPKAEPLIVPEQNHIPGLSHTYATDHLELPPTPTVSVTPAFPQTKSKLLSKKPSPLTLLAPFDMDQPQRSPAVSDDMLNSNFGTFGFRPPLSPLSPTESSVPSFEDLKFDFSFLQQNDSKSSRRRSNSPASDHSDSSLRRQKNTPSLRVSRPPSGPVGPPPTGPLPAVPAIPLGESTLSIPQSPQETRTAERPKSSRSGNSPPSAFLKQKTAGPLIKAANTSKTNNDILQAKPLPNPHSLLKPVGMPSIMAHVPGSTGTQEDPTSNTHNPISIGNHRRAKSSGKYSIGGNIKGFASATMLCN